jgi:mRNA interferase MazF
MTCSPGDLLLIPFPYADLTSAKKRPVLALTAPDRHGDFIALAVTSVEQVEQAVRLEPVQLSLGTLARTSWVRLDKIFTLSASNISKSIGRVETGIIQEILAGLCATVGFAPGS